MRRPELSIAKLMVLVAVLAINLASLKALHMYDSDLGQGLSITGFVLQLAIYRALCDRGGGRIFWIGLAAMNLVTMVSFVGCIFFLESTNARWWMTYNKYANRLLNSLTHVWDYYNRTEDYPVLVVTMAFVWFVPQWILGVTAGSLARAVYGLMRLRRFAGRLQTG